MPDAEATALIVPDEAVEALERFALKVREGYGEVDARAVRGIAESVVAGWTQQITDELTEQCRGCEGDHARLLDAVTDWWLDVRARADSFTTYSHRVDHRHG